MQNNHLQGVIPKTIGTLTSLQKLAVNSNELSGAIPGEIGQLSSLDLLDLDHNQLTGAIPPELGNLVTLSRNLTLNDNHLTGTIPISLGNLVNLREVHFENNPGPNGDTDKGLHGPIPTEFLNLKFLHSFRYYNTGICLPDKQEFSEWYAALQDRDSPARICTLPVVLVHGYNDTGDSWGDYINTLLPSIDPTHARVYKGYPVYLDTGYGDRVANTVWVNAQQLGSYIKQVKNETGQDQVDIVAHSMGGLISRAYIGRNMDKAKPDVHQLIMLGTPNGGSNSAALLEMIHNTGMDWVNAVIFQPYIVNATNELTPQFLRFFNSVVQNPADVPFYGLAGQYLCPVRFPASMPLEPWPNDVVVSELSVKAIPLIREVSYPTVAGCSGDHRTMRQIGYLYGGKGIFDSFVSPLLQNQTLPFQTQSTTVMQPTQNNSMGLGAMQFTDIHTTTLKHGQHQEFTFNINENVSQTTFTVMGNPDQMIVSMRTPIGILITPTTNNSQIIYTQMNDFMLMSGYTVSNPVNGTWTLILDANDQTPSTGVDAIMLNAFDSSLSLDVSLGSEELILNASTVITAQITGDGQPITTSNVILTMTNLLGITQQYWMLDTGQLGDVAANDGVYSLVFTPTLPGHYTAIVKATGNFKGTSYNRWSYWSAGMAHDMYMPIVRVP